VSSSRVKNRTVVLYETKFSVESAETQE